MMAVELRKKKKYMNLQQQVCIRKWFSDTPPVQKGVKHRRFIDITAILLSK